MRMRWVALAALAAALVAAAPARAATLTIDFASVVFPDANPGTPGRMQLEGRFTGLAIDPRTMVRLGVGASTRWVNLRKGVGDTYGVRSGEHGYDLTLDLRLGRFSATEVDVLPGRENPVAIELRQGPRVACTMIELGEDGQRWTFGAGRNRQFPCILRDTPAAEPPVLSPGTATKVRFRVAVASGRRPDRGGLRLVRLGEPGGPLCELRDRGLAEDGDEQVGDGVFACVVTLTETAPVRVRAEGPFGGTSVVSPSLTLEVQAADGTGAPPAP
jgi:hypothetical protein